MERIRVLLVEPGEKPRLVTVPHTLDELQKLVGGYIAATYPWKDLVAVVFDDDGMAKGYPPNRLLVDEAGKPYDILKGTFFICGLSVDDFASISDELAEKYMKKFEVPEVFARFGDHVIWFKDKPGARPQMLF
jgi:hypothetical protein